MREFELCTVTKWRRVRMIKSKGVRREGLFLARVRVKRNESKNWLDKPFDGNRVLKYISKEKVRESDTESSD